MSLPVPERGLVIGYSYLWSEDERLGREEGLKDRPCAIVTAVEDEEDNVIVTVLPITHVHPAISREAVEIPPAVKRHLGLDDNPSWIIITEANRFSWPGPDLHPVSRSDPMRFDYGFLPPKLMGRITVALREYLAAKRPHIITRND